VESSTCRANEQVNRHARIHTIGHAEVNGTVRANGPEFFQKISDVGVNLVDTLFDAGIRCTHWWLCRGTVTAHRTEQIKSPVNRSTYLYLKYLYDVGFYRLFKNYRMRIMRIQIRYWKASITQIPLLCNKRVSEIYQSQSYTLAKRIKFLKKLLFILPKIRIFIQHTSFLHKYNTKYVVYMCNNT